MILIVQKLCERDFRLFTNMILNDVTEDRNMVYYYTKLRNIILLKVICLYSTDLIVIRIIKNGKYTMGKELHKI